jgi:hypothetical protein
MRPALLVIWALLVCPGWLCAQSRAADPCDITVLPQEIQTKLEKNYPDWQPRRLENLSKFNRQFWLKAHPNDCPGIAIGRFEPKTELSYALFLVGRPERKQPGASIVVFSRTGPSVPFVPHLVSKWDAGNFDAFPDLVISKVPPGQYAEYNDSDEPPRRCRSIWTASCMRLWDRPQVSTTGKTAAIKESLFQTRACPHSLFR